MRLLVAGLVVAVAVVPAAADELAPRRVTSTPHDTHAVFDVRVRVPLDATTFPAGTAQLALPVGAVVTRGRAFTGTVVHALPLTEAARASDAFYALGSAPTAEPRGVAVQVTALTGQVQIEIASPRADALDMALEVDAPTCFSHDRRWVQVPESWRAAVAGAGAIDDAPPGCTASGDGPWVSWRAPLPRGVQLGVVGGRVVVPGGELAKVEVDLARELATVPDDLATVILVDGSRSLTDAQRDVQRTIVASYLAHTPASLVQVISVARTAQPLLPSWMASSVAAARVDRELRRITGVNGSNVDVGLAAAGAWLSRMTGTHRVIVLTDELEPERLTTIDPQTWAGLLPAGTIVHVVALRGADDELRREDGVLYGALAKATGGIGTTGGALSDAAMLVRPLSLDQVAFEGTGWEPDGTEACPDRLDAGTSCSWFARAAAAGGPVHVTGLLWNTKVTRVVVPERARGLAVARELSASGNLDTPVQLEIDRAARAVNSVWSLFGAWGGRGGYADQLGFGTSGTLSGHSSATIVDRFGSATRSNELDLAAQFAGALAACGPSTHGAVTIRLTLEEITDVRVRDAGADTSCIEEAIWSTLVHVPDAPVESVSRFTL